VAKASFRAAQFKILDIKRVEFKHRTFENRLRRKRQRKQFPLAFHKKRAWHRQVSQGNLDLSGATYELINADLDNLLRCLDPYDRQPYTLLEKSYRSIGQDREADIISYDGYCRTGQQLWDEVLTEDLKATPPKRRDYRGLPRAVSNGLQRKVFRYGIRPYRLLAFSLLILAIGTFVFAAENSIMHKDAAKREKEPNHQTTWEEAVNMSLRQFIPVVEIPPGAEWLPSDKKYVPYLEWAHFNYAGYATLHRLFGFILIPTGVAALAGLLQRRNRPGK
jgi:hypothetical protein